ncbi:hypothetical protein ACFFHK_03630 [Gallibacterium trehalosifermentans]|uniref:Uncharacterized protein n=1 Tax=Gallibacterium trehalosifermentans TaxID=516935 RepID=A0ABV6H0C7_9PAST
MALCYIFSAHCETMLLGGRSPSGGASAKYKPNIGDYLMKKILKFFILITIALLLKGDNGRQPETPKNSNVVCNSNEQQE